MQSDARYGVYKNGAFRSFGPEIRFEFEYKVFGRFVTDRVPYQCKTADKFNQIDENDSFETRRLVRTGVVIYFLFKRMQGRKDIC